MAEKLKGKVAIVTGAGEGGIGEAVAIGLAAEGASVVVNDVKRDLADRVVAKIIEAKGAAVANYESVGSYAGAERIVQTAIDNFGKLDILVNNAGNFMLAPDFEITEEQWDLILNVHLKGTFSCIRAAFPHMQKQKGGRIVNFSSRGAFFGKAMNLAYTSAKAAILGLTSVLAENLKTYGITVNAILPSAVTKLFPDPNPRLHFDTPFTPLWKDPQYVAPIVLYLCTDEAKEITGQFFYASGGDICIYTHPLLLRGRSPIFIRKNGKWTIDELAEIIPTLIK